MSKKILSLVSVSLFAIASACTKIPNSDGFAETNSENATTTIERQVKCVLSNPDVKIEGVLDLTSNPDSHSGLESFNENMDLSFHVSDSIDNESGLHVVQVLFSSMEIADEVGSTAFEIPKDAVKGKIFEEPIENAPDGKTYFFQCEIL